MQFGWLTLAHSGSPEGDYGAIHELVAQACFAETMGFEATRVNPWNDPRVSDEDGVRYSLETATLCGTPEHVADRLGELRDAGVHHVLCQMSYGYLPHAAIVDSMRRFGEDVIPRFR